ncbi:hypothetical protein Tco_0833959 [Tanacetum coccineum]
MATRSRKKAIAEPATPRARDPRDVEMIERLQQRIQELEFQQLHFKEEPIMFVEDESCPVYDTDNEEEESMPVYDTDIKDVIEEEEGFIGKGGSNEEEKDGDKDEVVYADDINQNDIGHYNVSATFIVSDLSPYYGESEDEENSCDPDSLIRVKVLRVKIDFMLGSMIRGKL